MMHNPELNSRWRVLVDRITNPFQYFGGKGNLLNKLLQMFNAELAEELVWVMSELNRCTADKAASWEPVNK